jgi:hypothetical protein
MLAILKMGKSPKCGKAVKCGNGGIFGVLVHTYWNIYLGMYEKTFVAKPSGTTVKKAWKKLVKTCFCVWCS